MEQCNKNISQKKLITFTSVPWTWSHVTLRKLWNISTGWDAVQQWKCGSCRKWYVSSSLLILRHVSNSCKQSLIIVKVQFPSYHTMFIFNCVSHQERGCDAKNAEKYRLRFEVTIKTDEQNESRWIQANWTLLIASIEFNWIYKK